MRYEVFARGDGFPAGIKLRMKTATGALLRYGALKLLTDDISALDPQGRPVTCVQLLELARRERDLAP